MASSINIDAFEYIRTEHGDEMEVLAAIYDGDANFKAIDGSTIQYKIGENEEPLSILVEIKWTAEYPDSIPNINLDSFYNQHLPPAAKKEAINGINEEAWRNVGEQQTYTLIEWMKDNILPLIGSYVFDEVCRIENRENHSPEKDDEKEEEQPKKETRKEQMTKAQKRREWDRVDKDGNRARGSDWVDVVKHLSQTGGGQSTSTATTDTSKPST